MQSAPQSAVSSPSTSRCSPLEAQSAKASTPPASCSVSDQLAAEVTTSTKTRQEYVSQTVEEVLAASPIPQTSTSSRILTILLQIFRTISPILNEQSAENYQGDPTESNSQSKHSSFADFLLEPSHDIEEKALKDNLLRAVLTSTQSAAQSSDPALWSLLEDRDFFEFIMCDSDSNSDKPALLTADGWKSCLYPSEQEVRSSSLTLDKMEMGLNFRLWSRSLRLLGNTVRSRYTLNRAPKAYQAAIRHESRIDASSWLAFQQIQQHLPRTRLGAQLNDDTFHLYVKAAFNGLELFGESKVHSEREHSSSSQSFIHWRHSNDSLITSLPDNYDFSLVGNQWAHVLDTEIYDPAMQAFLHDVIISNQLEACIAKQQNYMFCKVTRARDYWTAMDKLSQDVSLLPPPEPSSARLKAASPPAITNQLVVLTSENVAQPKKIGKGRKRSRKNKKQKQQPYDTDETMEDPDVAHTESPAGKFCVEVAVKGLSPVVGYEVSENIDVPVSAQVPVINASLNNTAIPIKVTASSSLSKFDQGAIEPAGGLRERASKRIVTKASRNTSIATTAVDHSLKKKIAGLKTSSSSTSKQEVTTIFPKEATPSGVPAKGKVVVDVVQRNDSRFTRGEGSDLTQRINDSSIKNMKNDPAPKSSKKLTIATNAKNEDKPEATSTKALVKKGSLLETIPPIGSNRAHPSHDINHAIDLEYVNDDHEGSWQVVASKASAKSKSARKKYGRGDQNMSTSMHAEPKGFNSEQNSFTRRHGRPPQSQSNDRKSTSHIRQQATNDTFHQPALRPEDFPAMPVSERKEIMSLPAKSLVGRKVNPPTKLNVPTKRNGSLAQSSADAPFRDSHDPVVSKASITNRSAAGMSTKAGENLRTEMEADHTVQTARANGDTYTESVIVHSEVSDGIIDQEEKKSLGNPAAILVSFSPGSDGLDRDHTVLDQPGLYRQDDRSPEAEVLNDSFSTIFESDQIKFTDIANNSTAEVDFDHSRSPNIKTNSGTVDDSQTEADSTSDHLGEEMSSSTAKNFILTLLDENPRSANSLAHRGRSKSAPGAIKELYDISEFYADIDISDSAVNSPSSSAHSSPVKINTDKVCKSVEDDTPPNNSFQVSDISAIAPFAKPIPQQEMLTHQSTPDDKGSISAIQQDGSRYSIVFNNDSEQYFHHQRVAMNHCSGDASVCLPQTSQIGSEPITDPGVNMHVSVPSRNIGTPGFSMFDTYGHIGFIGHELERQHFYQAPGLFQQTGPMTDVRIGTNAVQSIQYTCTYCRSLETATFRDPGVLCASCGPFQDYIYCSTACLLVDAMNHSRRCRHYAVYDANDLSSLHVPAVYRIPPAPLIQLDQEFNTSENSRQRAFSMNTRYGSFPPLLSAWLKRNPFPEYFNLYDGDKRTGIYYIFRSRITTDVFGGPNPDADVLCTIDFHRANPVRHMLSRALNVCFLAIHPRILKFLFRAIRSFIVDDAVFRNFGSTVSASRVLDEFVVQFQLEFGFGPTDYNQEDRVFNLEAEWTGIAHLMEHMESTYPALRVWDRRADAYI